MPYYLIEYVIVVDVSFGTIKYRDARCTDNEYSIQICDFITYYEKLK